jgi:HD-GYP domain-containing protein (c-di-GMP phosphodiesterase class II)
MKNSNLTVIKIKDLTIGMYVIIPLSWYQHPFLSNEFIINSEAEIEKIKALGVKEIQIDPARCRHMAEPDLTKKSPVNKPEEKKEAQNIVPDDLIKAVHNKLLPPREKAMIVQKHSFSMMKNLLDNPTAENIMEAKKGISEIVGLVLKDDATLFYLLNITEHDYYTYTHSVDVGILGVAMAKSLFKDAGTHDIQALGAGFFLHDIGKVNIDTNIINKPGKLTDEEMNEMRQHPMIGFKLLHDMNQLTYESRIIALQHHERADGTGYPKGLREHEIHLYGRICSIADVYDALTTDRPYRQKMEPFKALKLMHDEMINHFQKDLFERFILLFNKPAGH